MEKICSLRTGRFEAGQNVANSQPAVPGGKARLTCGEGRFGQAVPAGRTSWPPNCLRIMASSFDE